jgi:hypothetical protein
MRTSFVNQRMYTRSSGSKNTFGDFTCMHCRSFVCADAALSGVHNRNHCPYCLVSRHLDLFEAGDRLSACKGAMLPVALTWKRSLKKYARPGDGELMLIHQCKDCDRLSINRIAADDDNALILSLLHDPAGLDRQILGACAAAGIDVLGAADIQRVTRALFGQN